MKKYEQFIKEQAAPAPVTPAPAAPAPAPAPAPATPVYKPPVQKTADYTGYSEEGIANDKKAEAELQTYINSNVSKLDETYKNYSKNPQQGIKILDQLRQEVDNHLTPNMKSAQNYPTIYDLFFHKYSYYKAIMSNPTQQTK